MLFLQFLFNDIIHNAIVHSTAKNKSTNQKIEQDFREVKSTLIHPDVTPSSYLNFNARIPETNIVTKEI